MNSPTQADAVDGMGYNDNELLGRMGITPSARHIFQGKINNDARSTPHITQQNHNMSNNTRLLRSCKYGSINNHNGNKYNNNHNHDTGARPMAPRLRLPHPRLPRHLRRHLQYEPLLRQRTAEPHPQQWQHGPGPDPHLAHRRRLIRLAHRKLHAEGGRGALPTQGLFGMGAVAEDVGGGGRSSPRSRRRRRRH